MLHYTERSIKAWSVRCTNKRRSFNQNTKSEDRGRSQDFSKGGGGAEVMEAKALKRKICLWLEYIAKEST